MPLPTETKRRTAVEIVLTEERAKGWTPELAGSWAREREYGCDLLSTPPSGGPPDRVEVKGWGAPLLNPKGTFTWGQDIRISQYEAAMAHSNYRIEIVANLDGFLRGEGVYDRLTLTSEYIRAHAVPRGYDIPLDGLRDQARRVEGRPSTDLATADDAVPGTVDAILADTSMPAPEKIDALRDLAESGDQSVGA